MSFLQKWINIPRTGSGTHWRVWCEPLQARPKDYKDQNRSGKKPPTGKSGTKIPSLCPAPGNSRAHRGSSGPTHEGTRHRVRPPTSSDVKGRDQPDRATVDPAVTRRSHSQSAPAASAGRPLNSAQQLPAVWRVHSAMQYVCQRCGTKEQPFCD